MRYTVEYSSLVNNAYITINIGDVIAGIDVNPPVDKIVVLRINKTGRDF